MRPPTKYTSLFLDLGDVLFNWSPETKTSISPRQLKKILSSDTWREYECGRLTQKQCYQHIARQFSLEVTEIATAFSQARDSLCSNDDMISAVRQLKTESHGSLRVYAMSNISLPDYRYLRTKPADWAIFDDVFASAAVGQRKPNPGFYEYVLKATNTEPKNAIFVDDKVENVLSAECLGFHGILFSDSLLVAQALRNLLGDPLKRGQAFLDRNAKMMVSETDNSISIKDNFAQLLILEATNNWY
jgi:FMN phosphatase YigB (HAD superfamily)